MEDDKKSCCGLGKVSKVGRAVIIGCAIFAILAIGFSWGVSLNSQRMMGGFNNEKYNHFDNDRDFRRDGGCQMQKINGGCNQQETGGGCPMQKQEGGCGGKIGGLSPEAGCNFERQLDNNGIQSLTNTTTNPSIE
jgi:hypothetical protein